MNLSAKQIAIRNQLFLHTHLLNDLCRIVAQYVCSHSFENKLKNTIKVESDYELKDYQVVQQNGKHKLLLPFQYICLLTGVTTPKRNLYNGKGGGWMKGERWIWLCKCICRNGIRVRPMNVCCRWLGCDESLEEVYFQKSFIRSMKKAKKPLLRMKSSTSCLSLFTLGIRCMQSKAENW